MLNPFKSSKFPADFKAQEIYIDKLPIDIGLKQETKQAFLRQIKDEYEDTDLGYTQKYQDVQLIRDVTIMGTDAMKPKNKSYILMSGREVAGYAPSGSILRKLYPNEFTLFSFLSEAYWAMVKSRHEIWVETVRDSYSLVAPDNVPKKTIKLIDGVLKDLNVPYWRCRLKDILMVNGNVVLMNEFNKQGGLIKINPLLMEKLMARYDRNFDTLIGWDYTLGNTRFLIPYDKADHIANGWNMRSNILGTSCWASIIVDAEAALQGAIYNNNLMQRGGLLSVIIALKDPKNAAIINDRVSLNLADEFTKWLNKTWGGIRGAAGMAFVPMVDGVHPLSKISEMDSAWTKLDDIVARKSALLAGVPPERIGITAPNNSQYKNNAMVADTMALSFDNNNYFTQGLIDDYLTNLIIKQQLGIDNVRIECAGEFSAISKIGAEFGLAISQMGADTMTVGEFRTDVLHIKPLEDEEKNNAFLGEFFRKDIPNENGLNGAMGKAKHFLPAYRQYRANKIAYRSKDIPFIC